MKIRNNAAATHAAVVLAAANADSSASTATINNANVQFDIKTNLQSGSPLRICRSPDPWAKRLATRAHSWTGQAPPSQPAWCSPTHEGPITGSVPRSTRAGGLRSLPAALRFAVKVFHSNILSLWFPVSIFRRSVSSQLKWGHTPDTGGHDGKSRDSSLNPRAASDLYPGSPSHVAMSGGASLAFCGATPPFRLFPPASHAVGMSRARLSAIQLTEQLKPKGIVCVTRS